MADNRPRSDTATASTAPPSALPVELDRAMTIDEFSVLASKLANLGLFREAIKLYETAAALHPQNIALKINLARVRDMKRRSDADILREFDGSIRAQRAREDRLAYQYLGLGQLHYRRGDLARARDYFEFAARQNSSLFEPPLFLARIAVAQADSTRAIRLLEEARHLNPFSEEAVDLLATQYMERGDNEQAMHAYLDALVLSGGVEGGRESFFQGKLRELLKRLGRDARTDLPAMVRERTARFASLAEKLEERRREALHERAAERLQTIFAAYSTRAKTDERPTVDLTPYRAFPIFAAVNEAGLLALSQRLERREVAAEQKVFGEGESTDSLFLLESGSVRVCKSTPLGEHVLSTFDPGDAFGEMNFLDERPHSADAVANEASVLLVLTRQDATAVFEEQRHVAVQVYSYFWRTLAERIRATNDKMKTFFVAEAMNADRHLNRKQLADAEQVIVDIDRKIALFKEKGLSGHDLELLASLSSEELYNKDDLIFQEGDAGGKLYIVLDGKVRISKSIPGVGEEALSVLERGDFFGEMSLVDNQPRSADARVHEDRTTVISIDKAALEDILSADAATASHFLGILCRILAQRLREINETIVKWRIMSGGFA